MIRLALGLLLLSYLPSAASAQLVDTFEDLGADGTPVTSRVVGGITITLSSTAGVPFTARTYGSANELAFGGAGAAPNTPLRPENLSGSRFISTVQGTAYFEAHQPLVFELDQPVSAFGLTTVDLLEDTIGNNEFVALRAMDELGQVVSEHRRTGAQDASGLDLPWRVSTEQPLIREVHLYTTNLVNGGGYGIDDLFVREAPLGHLTVQVAQESAPAAGDFDQNVLGTITTWDYVLTVPQFYGWYPTSTSFTGPAPLPAVDGRSFLAIFRSTTTGEQAAVVVHDSTQDGSGGTALTRVEIQGDANGAGWLQQDDPMAIDDIYTGTTGSSIFTANQNWATCCTDGYALGALEGSWSVLVEFTAQPIGVTSWSAVASDASQVVLALEPGRRVRLRSLAGTGTTGVRYCFGDGTGLACPCGNDSAPGQGCGNSSGFGAVLTGVGSPSVSADDLTLETAQVAPFQNGILFMGPEQTETVFGDGLRCSGAGALQIFRFPIQSSGAGGILAQGPGLADFAAQHFPLTGQILPGSTWRFQAWYRDPQGPCGSGFNLSNALTVTFGP